MPQSSTRCHRLPPALLYDARIDASRSTYHPRWCVGSRWLRCEWLGRRSRGLTIGLRDLRYGLTVVDKPVWWRHEQHGLSHWWLAGGDLKDTRFELPNTGLVNPPNVLLFGARFQGVDFSRLAFDAFTVADSVISDCTFEKVSFRTIDLGLHQYHQDWNRPIDWSKPLKVKAPRYGQTRYVRCRFIKIKFPRHNTYFGNCRFDECVFDDTLRSTVVAPIFTAPAEFVNCRFVGGVSCVVFDGKMGGRDIAARIGRSECAFVGNDFTQAVLKSVDFRDINLAAQRLPPEFDAHK